MSKFIIHFRRARRQSFANHAPDSGFVKSLDYFETTTARTTYLADGFLAGVTRPKAQKLTQTEVDKILPFLKEQESSGKIYEVTVAEV